MTAALTPEGLAAEVAALRAALDAASGNVGRAAVALGVNRRTLDRRINALGLRAWLTGDYPRAIRQTTSRHVQEDSMAERYTAEWYEEQKSKGRRIRSGAERLPHTTHPQPELMAHATIGREEGAHAFALGVREERRRLAAILRDLDKGDLPVRLRDLVTSLEATPLLADPPAGWPARLPVE